MPQQNIMRAWKDAEYRNSLSTTERAAFVVIAVMLSALLSGGALANGDWSFAIVPYDSAGNETRPGLLASRARASPPSRFRRRRSIW